MAQILITNSLFKKIKKKFDNSEANKIIALMNSLEDNPKKGREVGVVGNIVVKEIKEIFIKFVGMSEKKDQQKVIDGIKFVIRSLGEEGF